MILFHNPEDELSRALMASKPGGCAVVVYPDQFYSGPPPTVLPSVLVDVPEYEQAGVTVPAHQECLRAPESWDAVASFMALVAERALLRPAAQP